MVRPVKLSYEQLERVAELFRAFAETSRLAVLQELKSGPKTVSEIVAELPTSQANVSKQLKILHAAGLLDRRKDGTRVIYSINDAMAFELCEIVCDKLNRNAKAPAPLTFS
jgi:DNA-binding transcriptional ArsR family regulator